jgi:hypothetical protein
LESFGWDSSGAGSDDELSRGTDFGRVQDLWADEDEQAQDPDQGFDHDQGAIDNLMAPRVEEMHTYARGYSSDDEGSGTS